MRFQEFVQKYGRPYSEALNIDVRSGDNREIVKWFLASLLYSKPIRESSATKTYLCFERYGIISADKVLAAGWDRLVKILDEGGYTRYDFSTADKLLEVFGSLKRVYRGDLVRLHEAAENPRDLEARLKALGKGIGEVTVSVFLRDMRPIWVKADPRPSPLVEEALKKLGISDLKGCARSLGVDIVWLETALLRYAKDFLRKGIEIPLSL